MSAYTVSDAQNIDAYASKAGGDTYAINGGTLTIDQDSRYGLNASSTTSLGAITISATLGGRVEIDGRYVRLIPFTGGSGTATVGATITCGSATGKIIGIYSAINVAPVLTGVATGFIKVKGWNGVAFPTSGTYTQGGYTFTISGADTAGWIEVVGDEAATATVPRLGTFRARGAWFDLGNTSGDRATTYQLPTNGNALYCAGVWVEKTSGGDLEFYPNAGSLVAAGSVGTDAVRGKVCWISTTGVLRFGHDGTNSDTGYLPTAGLKIRVPNVFLQNCTTAARAANALPNVTLATRYDFTTTAGGEVVFDTVASAWAMSFNQPYAVTLNYVAVCDSVIVALILSASTWTQVGVGMSGSMSTLPLQIDTCYAGLTLTDCTFPRYTVAGQNIVQVQYSDRLTFTRLRAFCFALRTSANAVAAYVGYCTNVVFNDALVGSAGWSLIGCDAVTIARSTYFDNIVGATTSANQLSTFKTGSATRNVVIDGFSYGGLSNVNAYGYLLLVGTYMCSNVTLRNIGTPSSPLSLGPAIPGKPLSLAGSSADVNLQRIYLRDVGTINSGDSSVVGVVMQNVFLDYADDLTMACQDFIGKGVRATEFIASGSGRAGSIFGDVFSGDTTGAIYFVGNEPTSTYASYVTLANGARFTGSANGVSLPEIGMSVTWEMPYHALGHTALTSVTIANAANFLVEFQADVNDGSGFSAWATASASNLAAVTIDASKGVKLRVRVSAVVTNTTAVPRVGINTTTTLDAQAYQYPLEMATVMVDGLVDGSMVRASKVSDGTTLFVGMAASGVVTFETDYAGAVAIEARKSSSSPYYRPWQSRVTTVLGSTVSATAVQQLDE